MKRMLSAVVVLLVAVLASVSIVNAASLDLTRPSMTTTNISDRCAASVGATSGTRTSTGSATSVVLTGLTADCAGRRVSLTLFKSNGTVVTTVSDAPLGAVTNGKATVTVPAFPAGTVDRIALTIGTWGIPASWTKPPPLPLAGCSIIGRPDVACTALVEPFDPWVSGFDVNITITTTPATPGAQWELALNLADPKLPQPIRSIQSWTPLKAGTTCDSLPYVTFVGKTAEWITRSDGKAGPVSIQGYTTSQGASLNCP